MSERPSLERMAAISALLTEFCWCADNDRGDIVAELFTEDAVVDAPQFRLVGKDAIAASFTGRSGTKLSQHNWSNLRVTPLAEGKYRVESNMINGVGVLRAPQYRGRIVLATSVDEVIFDDSDRPLFASRTLHIAFDGILAGEEVPA